MPDVITVFSEIIVNLWCCGNCGNMTTRNCPKWTVGMLSSDYETWQCCDSWSPDGMTRLERSKP
jgi:hypothetical protein